MHHKVSPLLALLTLLVPCFAQADNQPLKIGGIFALSNDIASVWGNAEKNGYLLAIEDFRAQHPQVEVESIIEDSAYAIPTALSALNSLMIRDVKFIVGPTWETSVALMPVCEKNQLICFSPSHNGPEFKDKKTPTRFNFTAWFEDRGHGDVIAAEINRRGFKKVALLSSISLGLSCSEQR
jgi:ABC-type branched-subunit amino acid transport system substrate-binding protein